MPSLLFKANTVEWGGESDAINILIHFSGTELQR